MSTNTTDTTAALVAAGLDENPWARRIIAAESRGHFTAADRAHAGRWDMCAVGLCAGGNDCSGIGEPLDSELRAAGGTFHAAVEADPPEYLKAAYQLVLIHHRAAQIAAA